VPARPKEWTKLETNLRRQGFLISDTSEGVRVKNPIMEKEHLFHPSSLIYHSGAVVRDLKMIGYVEPDEFKRRKKASHKRAPGHFICADPICGCGRDFPYAQNLGRHLAAVRERAAKEKGEAKSEERPQITRPTPPDDVRQLRGVMRRLRTLSEETAELADLIGRCLDENQELKRKLAKVEEYFGKALDSL
jgi:hypothetical protein